MSIGVTLRTDKSHRFNRGAIIGGIEVKFDEVGMVEVPERQVAKLVEGGLEIVDEADIEKYKEDISFDAAKEQQLADVDVHDANTKLKAQNETLKTKNIAISADFTELEGEVVELKAKIAELTDLMTPKAEFTEDAPENTEDNEEGLSINDMNDAELKALCKEVKLPKKEWGKLEGKELKEYIEGKLK